MFIFPSSLKIFIKKIDKSETMIIKMIIICKSTFKNVSVNASKIVVANFSENVILRYNIQKSFTVYQQVCNNYCTLICIRSMIFISFIIFHNVWLIM